MLAAKIVVAAPTGITVTNHVGYSLIDWTDITDPYFGKAEIWVSLDNNIANATKATETEARDKVRVLLAARNDEIAVYYAWVRCISIYGDAGPYSAAVALAPGALSIVYGRSLEDFPDAWPTPWAGTIPAGYDTWVDASAGWAINLDDALYQHFRLDALFDVEVTGTPTLGTDDGGYWVLEARVEVLRTLPTPDYTFHASSPMPVMKFWRQGGVYLSFVKPFVFREEFWWRIGQDENIPLGAPSKFEFRVQFRRRRSGVTWDMPDANWRLARGDQFVQVLDWEV